MNNTSFVKPVMSYGPEIPAWLPKEKKQDIIDLQIKTFNTPKGRTRRPRIRKRDPNHVPRPMNSFLSYRTEQQHFIRKYCPGANHREISKIVAKWWHELNEHDKELYREQATSAKMKHAEKYPDYKFTPKKKKNSKSTGTHTSKNVQSKKTLTEEMLYTNIHDAADSKNYKGHQACKYASTNDNNLSVDPIIAETAATAAVLMSTTTAAAAAASAFIDQGSFQDVSSFMNFFNGNSKTCKLLEPYSYQDPSIMSVMFPNGTMNQMPVYMNDQQALDYVDAPLFAGQYEEAYQHVPEPLASQFTPALDYSESPADICLPSPQTTYPSSFSLSNAYSYNFTDAMNTGSNDIMWN